MPRETDLTVQVYEDFTGGLYDRGDDRECAPNGLLELIDAYPQPRGGLRAFARFQPISQTNWGSGADATAGSIPFGIYSQPGIFATDTIFATELQINQGGAGIHRLRMLNLSGEDTTALTSGTWEAVATIGGITATSAGIKTATLRNLTNGYRAYFDLAATPTSLGGIYRFTTSTSAQAFTTNTAIAPHGLISAQGRLIYISHESTVLGVPNLIQYTSFSTDAAPSTANFLAPLVERSLPLQWIAAYAPSDILGLKLGAGLFSAQGDISAGPTIRELTFDHNVSVMYPVSTDLGLVFHVEGQGIYAYTQGLSVEPLSQQILGDPFGSAELASPNWSGISFNYRGQLAYSDSFLYAGKYVMDARTKAWFQLSGMDYASPTVGGMPAYAAVDVSNHRIYIANYGRATPSGTGLNRQILWWSPSNEQDWTRSNTFSFTLPLIDQVERNTEVRYVEIFGQAFGNGGTWTMTPTTPDGELTAQAGTVTFTSAGACSTRFNVRANADWVKLRFTSEGRFSAEAPMVSSVAVYSQPRQMRPT